MDELTTDMLLYAYRNGYFPMADPHAADTIYWYAPDPRGIIPLDRFHVSRNLAKLVRRGVFEVSTDRCFEEVMRACSGRLVTWISEEIISTYTQLHRMGFAHSVECWSKGRLAGGLYGVAIGGAFFGESMFSRERDASKVALVHLVDLLHRGGYRLLDTQFITPHLEQFGAVEVTRAEYGKRLAQALAVDGIWSS